MNIVQYADGRLELFLGTQSVEFDRHDWLQTKTRSKADAKQLNAHVDDLASLVQVKEMRRLARLHNQIAAEQSSGQDVYQNAPA